MLNTYIKFLFENAGAWANSPILFHIEVPYILNFFHEIFIKINRVPNIWVVFKIDDAQVYNIDNSNYNDKDSCTSHDSQLIATARFPDAPEQCREMDRYL